MVVLGAVEVVEDSEVVVVAVEDMEVEVEVEATEVEVAVGQDLEEDLRITGRMTLVRAKARVT